MAKNTSSKKIKFKDVLTVAEKALIVLVPLFIYHLSKKSLLNLGLSIFCGSAIIFIFYIIHYVLTKKGTKKKRKQRKRQAPKILSKLLPVGLAKWVRWFIAGIILFFVGLVIANQAMQPLFAPRIDSYSINPLYMRGHRERNTEKKDFDISYIQIYKITYKISTPLHIPIFTSLLSIFFPIKVTKKINIKIPEDSEFLTQITEKNPYVEPYADKFNSSFHSEDFNLEIIPTAWGVKTVELSLFFRTRADISEVDIYRTLPGLWKPGTESPEKPNEVGIYKKIIGYGLLKDSCFRFKELIIENRMDQEIREFHHRFSTNLGYATLCDYKSKPPITEEGNNNYVFFLLKPKETKKFLIAEKIEQPCDEFINLTSLDCDYIWNVFIKNESG